MIKNLKNIMRPKFQGNMITIDLSKWGYDGYFVECTYRFIKKDEKYALSVYLNRNDLEDKLKLTSKNIDTQYIQSTKENIVENICEIIHHMAVQEDFDYYVDCYEYELACFERGNELFEQERLAKLNDDKE